MQSRRLMSSMQISLEGGCRLFSPPQPQYTSLRCPVPITTCLSRKRHTFCTNCALSWRRCPEYRICATTGIFDVPRLSTCPTSRLSVHVTRHLYDLRVIR